MMAYLLVCPAACVFEPVCRRHVPVPERVPGRDALLEAPYRPTRVPREWFRTIASTSHHNHAARKVLYLPRHITLAHHHLPVSIVGFQGASVSNRAFLGSIPWLIVHRWLRLIPAYAFIIAVRPLITPLFMLSPCSSTRLCKSHRIIGGLRQVYGVLTSRSCT